ncbi:MAG: hypothetical protein IK048_05270 [Clostridia bacterium]|nr:hypothetical protein [Clostridia bacterium]
MDKIIIALKKPARLLLLIFVGAYALFELIYAIGRMDAGGGDAIAGGLFFLIAFCGLAFALIFALIKKNETAARFIGLACFGFLAVSLIYGLLGGAGGDSALDSAVFAFDFMAALAGIAIFAMMILGLFLPKLKENKIIALVSICLLLAFLFFTLLARLLEFGVYGEFNRRYREYGLTYPWYRIVGNLGEIFLLGAILFGYLMLFVKTPEVSEPAEAPAPQEEPVFEAEAVEDAPAEVEAEVEPAAEAPTPQEEPVLEAEVEAEVVEEQ